MQATINPLLIEVSSGHGNGDLKEEKEKELIGKKPLSARFRAARVCAGLFVVYLIYSFATIKR